VNCTTDSAIGLVSYYHNVVSVQFFNGTAIYLILYCNLLSVEIETCSSVEHLIYYDMEIWFISGVFYIS